MEEKSELRDITKLRNLEVINMDRTRNDFLVPDENLKADYPFRKRDVELGESPKSISLTRLDLPTTAMFDNSRGAEQPINKNPIPPVSVTPIEDDSVKTPTHVEAAVCTSNVRDPSFWGMVPLLLSIGVYSTIAYAILSFMKSRKPENSVGHSSCIMRI